MARLVQTRSNSDLHQGPLTDDADGFLSLPAGSRQHIATKVSSVRTAIFRRFAVQFMSVASVTAHSPHLFNAGGCTGVSASLEYHAPCCGAGKVMPPD